MKQTAVDFVFEKLANQGLLITRDYKNLVAYREAKQMERANIIDAYLTNPLEAKWKNIGTDYYNETFKTNEK